VLVGIVTTTDILGEPIPEKLADFRKNLQYERRVVVYYDVLGWRSQIGSAGSDPEKIGNLRRFILEHSRVLRMPSVHKLRVSTFSDNVVMTQAPSDNTWYLIQQLGLLQVASALGGFLIRGAVTIGDVVHDDEVVFGPGMNRAYEVESTIADVPRIVMDSQSLKELRALGPLPSTVIEERGISFIDPFSPRFLEFAIGKYKYENRERFAEAGVPVAPPTLKNMPGDLLLKSVLDNLKKEIRSPLHDKEWRKVAWLYDRIAERLGVPPARSYPRVRPG
jgi:hypothetical protein